jgi:hypothetical protein
LFDHLGSLFPKFLPDSVLALLATSSGLCAASIKNHGASSVVHYEIGFAHALGKKVVLIAQSKDDLVFDLRGIRTIFYTNPKDLREKLTKAIR